MLQSAPLILASQSPRRRELLKEAGYEFRIVVPGDHVECGVCSGQPPAELVAKLAFQKAKDVARRVDDGVVIGCDTVAECQGQILGKPVDERHARQMLQLLRGREHRVYSGLCLWKRPEDDFQVDVEVTLLKMQALDDTDIDEYLDTGGWEGKAGAFGYQDGLPWIEVVRGSESNVVGLPLELLSRMLRAMSYEL